MEYNGNVEVMIQSRMQLMLQSLRHRLEEIAGCELDFMVKELQGHCESCQILCQEFLTHREFARL